IRDAAVQRCPAVPNAPHSAPSTARSTSASSITMMMFLPPISRCTCLNCGAHATEMSRPTSVEPVNEMTATFGCRSIGSPTSRPPPVTTLNTPFAGHQEGHVDRFLDVAARLLEHLSHFPGHLARDFFLVALEDVADAVQELRASRGGRQPPRIERPIRRFDRGIQIIGIRFLKR